MKMLNKIIGSSIAIAAALAFSASTTQAATELLVNPGFETSPAGWTAGPITLATVGQGWANNFGGSPQGRNDMSSSADSPLSGSYALLGVNVPANAWNPQGTYQIIANSSVGASWSASIYALTDTGTQGAALAGVGPVDFQVQFLNSTLANISTVETGCSAINALDTWQQYTLGGAVPTGTEYISVYAMAMIGPGATNSVNVFFDNASLTVAPEPSTLALLGMGLAIPFYFIRRRKS